MLYCDYLSEVEREEAVQEAKTEILFAKLEMLCESIENKLQLDMREAELKVLSECGTYEDLDILYTEAQNEAAEKKKGVISTIINAIKSILSSISTGIKNFFTKLTKKPDIVQVPENTSKLHKIVKDLWAKVISAIEAIKTHKVASLVGVGLAGATGVAIVQLFKSLKKESGEKEDGENSSTQSGSSSSAGPAGFIEMKYTEVATIVEDCNSLIAQGEKALDPTTEVPSGDEEKATNELLQMLRKVIEWIKKWVNKLMGYITTAIAKIKDKSAKNNNTATTASTGGTGTTGNASGNLPDNRAGQAQIGTVKESVFDADSGDDVLTEMDEQEFDSLMEDINSL